MESKKFNPNPENELEPLKRAKEVAKEVGISSTAVLNMVRQGAVPGEFRKNQKGRGRECWVRTSDVLHARRTWYDVLDSLPINEDVDIIRRPIVEIAEEVGLSANRLRRMLNDGKIQGEQDGLHGKWSTSINDLREYIRTIPSNMRRPTWGYKKKD